MTKCQTCSHGKVCIHKTGYAQLVKKINDTLPGEEMLGMGESYPFSVEVNCKHCDEKPMFLRDQLQLAQQLAEQRRINEISFYK